MTFRLLAALGLFAATGCKEEPSSAQTPTDDLTQASRVCEDKTCLREGKNMFNDGNVKRKVHTFLPEDPTDAPVIFLWHYLGGSPEEILRFLPLDGAVDAGFIVVVPESRQVTLTEWDVSSFDPDANIDVQLFDAMRQSLIDVQGADPDRMYASGFSAGGLFTSYLTVHRSDALAASAPFSGGTPDGTYLTPTSDIPVMVSWGGPTDVLYGFDFHDASLKMADQLVADGHEVLSCEHSGGHSLPFDATDRTLMFFTDHAEGRPVADQAACIRP